MKDKNAVYMCMSCGNCKRSSEDNYLFKFNCKVGEFVIDSLFASKLEIVGCRTWMPSNDEFNEPFFIKLNEKKHSVEIGKFGKPFNEVDAEDFFNDMSNTDSYSEMIDVCKNAYGEEV